MMFAKFSSTFRTALHVPVVPLEKMQARADSSAMPLGSLRAGVRRYPRPCDDDSSTQKTDRLSDHSASDRCADGVRGSKEMTLQAVVTKQQ